MHGVRHDKLQWFAPMDGELKQYHNSSHQKGNMSRAGPVKYDKSEAMDRSIPEVGGMKKLKQSMFLKIGYITTTDG